MSDENQFPDELMLYALSRTYNRHTMLILKDRNWSTVASDNPISEQELWSICHVHLAYLGNGVFVEVKIKPFEGPHKDPITMEALARALNKIRGKGHPRSQPLNLVMKSNITDCELSCDLNSNDLVQDTNNDINDTVTPVPEDSTHDESVDTMHGLVSDLGNQLINQEKTSPLIELPLEVSIKGDNTPNPVSSLNLHLLYQTLINLLKKILQYLHCPRTFRSVKGEMTLL